jgi:pyruvate carboxylase
MALFMVTNNLTSDQVLNSAAPLAFPRSVVEMVEGRLGVPPEGWPEPLQKRILASAGVEWRPGLSEVQPPDIDLAATAQTLAITLQRQPTPEEVLSYVLYPQVFTDFAEHVQEYDNTSVLTTPAFFYGLQAGEEMAVEIERGKTLIIRYLTTSDVHEDGTRTVFFELNGQPRAAAVRDEAAGKLAPEKRKADPAERGHVAAPMPGKVSRVNVTPGQTVKEGDALLSIEAMKMETTVYSPLAGVVGEVLVDAGATVETKDLLVTIGERD